jgi:hypothetical protein
VLVGEPGGAATDSRFIVGVAIVDARYRCQLSGVSWEDYELLRGQGDEGARLHSKMPAEIAFPQVPHPSKLVTAVVQMRPIEGSLTYNH